MPETRPAPTMFRRIGPVLAVLVAAGTAIFALLAPAPVARAATLFSDDFEDGNAGGWTTSGGSWTVDTDGSRVYQQTGTSSDARARAGQASWTNYTVTTRVKPTAFNGSNRFVALLARAQNATNYYYLALRSSNVVELKKLVGGTAQTLASAQVPVSVGTWYTLRLEVSGSTLRGSVNGGTPLSASDTQYGAGQVGVATFNASAVFDDILVDGGTSGPTPTTTTTTTTGTPPQQPPAGSPIGWAGVNALGQNGVTGGAGGPVVTATTSEQFLDYIDTVGPLVIRVQGTMNITSKQGVRPNKTIVGVGTSGVINGGGLDFYRSFNVIVRNLKFTNAEDDAVNVGQNSHHIWIDHNEFVTPVDGSIDIVRGAEYVTVSWNWFNQTDKTMLIGHSDSNSGEDTGHLTVTIHHNFFDGSRQRHPRVRFGEPVHVFNNYFRGNELYGVASTMNGGVLLEGNYFENVPFPCFSASGYAESGPGRLVQRNNIFTGSGACEVAGGVAEPRNSYAYTLDPTANVPALVRAGVGIGRIGA
ncbi:MAG TPA: hypothetical protein VFV67_17070 [Actinophytocola sp.]|uniref:pectate lyase family protein n=1 Tax=Actinophytocola sp. TaxID=1872138 RepID=UPI002DBF48E2|nr:hypothetical protein [Actinophytocola sp.]HEU5472366.1 hypothetical protein [Actinophytocola sp.]